jgi:hypothetical protein
MIPDSRPATRLLAELSVVGNEASDLLPVVDPLLLRSLDARHAFWTVLDEGPVEQCLAVLVEQADGVWRARHLPVQAGAQAGRTEDGEALARHDGWVYVIGSHFGSKAGPLRPKRAFVARFRESAKPELEIVRHRFALHRVVNDALRELAAGGHPVAPAPPTDVVHTSFIEQTIRRGQLRGKAWVDQLDAGDHPINIEGVTFTAAGTLLLGLRWPVTAAGEPVLVEVAGVPELFAARPGPLRVVGIHSLAVGQPGPPLGVRALAARSDGSFDVIVGSIDAVNKGSVLLDVHPDSHLVTCRHLRFRLPEPGVRNAVLAAELVADLAPLHHVEGVADLAGAPLYVTDEDHRIALWS